MNQTNRSTNYERPCTTTHGIEKELSILSVSGPGVPPQSNSPPDTVPGAGRARHHERCSGARGTWSQKREPPAGLASPPHRARVKLNRVFFPR
ncbi:unnamed protein product [Lampetra planeri]